MVRETSSSFFMISRDLSQLWILLLRSLALKSLGISSGHSSLIAKAIPSEIGWSCLRADPISAGADCIASF